MNASLAQVVSENETDIFNETMEFYLDDGYQYNYENYFYYYNMVDIVAKQSPELQMMGYILYKYLLPIIWVISLLGNSLIICVLLRKKNRSHSVSMYLVFLALADLGVNTSNNLLVYLIAYGYFPMPKSDTDCFWNVAPFAFVMIAAWMLVMVSLERFIIVFDPIKGKQFCTAKLARVMSLAVWVIFFGLSVAYHAVFMEHVQLTNSIHMCLVRDKHVSLHYDVIRYVTISVKFFIPFVLIFSATTFIIVSLLNRKIRKSNSNQRKNSSVNVVLVIINIIYILTQFPYTFVLLFAESLTKEMTSVDQFIFYNYWMTFTIFIGDTNSAANVFVYFLTGSRFRNDTIEMVSGWFPQRWKTARKSKPTPGDRSESTAVRNSGKDE